VGEAIVAKILLVFMRPFENAERCRSRMNRALSVMVVAYGTTLIHATSGKGGKETTWSIFLRGFFIVVFFKVERSPK